MTGSRNEFNFYRLRMFQKVNIRQWIHTPSHLQSLITNLIIHCIITLVTKVKHCIYPNDLIEIRYCH